MPSCRHRKDCWRKAFWTVAIIPGYLLRVAMARVAGIAAITFFRQSSIYAVMPSLRRAFAVLPGNATMTPVFAVLNAAMMGKEGEASAVIAHFPGAATGWQFRYSGVAGPFAPSSLAVKAARIACSHCERWPVRPRDDGAIASLGGDSWPVIVAFPACKSPATIASVPILATHRS